MRARFAVPLVLLAVSGCTCKGRGLVNRVGEVVVVVAGPDGELLTREASVRLWATPMHSSTTADVHLRNIGNGALTVTQVRRVSGSEAITLDLPGPLALEPDAEATLTATFAPGQDPDATVAVAEHAALFEVTTTGTRPGEETATIAFAGSAVSFDCYVEPMLDFGQVLLRQRLTTPLTVRNDSALPGVASVSAIGGADALFFEAAVPADQPLNPGQAWALPISFTPTVERAYEATVRVRRAATCPEGVVRLVGTGSDAAVTWSPASVDFGRMPPGQQAQRTVVFSNAMHGPVGLKDARLEGGAWFSLVGAQPGLLAAQGQATFTLACAPDALGRQTGALLVDVLTTPSRTVRIPLACQGGGPRIRVEPRVLSYGEVPMVRTGTIVTSRRLAVSNVGSPPVAGDLSNNLFLGHNGLPPMISIIPSNPYTLSSEFTIVLPPSYNPAVGLEAIAGRNGVDLDVRLAPTTAGLKEADLIIYSNDGAEPATRVHVIATAVANQRPCTLSVTPSQLDFGTLPRGASSTGTVAIINTGTTPCLVSGIDLAPGTDPAFTLTGALASSTTLGSGQRVVVSVHITVPPTVSDGDFLSGMLRFTTIDGLSLVPLGAKVNACLTVTPRTKDYGTTRPGCRTTPTTFFIYNNCSVPVVVTDLSTTSAEFPIVQRPAIPAGGLSLAPAMAPLQTQVTFLPPVVGGFQGSLQVTGVEAGFARVVTVPLAGQATVEGLHTDNFVQPTQAKADVLFVVDNSCSMSDKQVSLANNFSQFILQADLQHVDYQLAATTTDMTPLGEQGRLLTSTFSPALITSQTTQVVQRFAAKVNVGVNGSGMEEPIAAAVAALTSPLLTTTSAGLVRTDATLAVIVVSDAVDQSPDPAAWYLDKLVQVKGADHRWQFSFNVVGPFTSPVPAGCTYDSVTDVGTRYTSLITATQGLRADICTADWGRTLEELGRNTLGVRSSFPLGVMPDASSIVVRVNGQPVGSWSYDGTLNAIVFTGPPPGPGTTLTISYPAVCY